MTTLPTPPFLPQPSFSHILWTSGSIPEVAPGKEPFVYQGDKETKLSEYDVVVVGAGLSGAVLARKLAIEQKK
eukprot:1358037-Amorphochlora_amoeboformis.AAC.1